MLLFFILLKLINLSFCLKSNTKSATHFVFYGNQIRPVEDSFFILDKPGDLCALIKQEEVYKQLIDTSIELLKLERKVHDDEKNEVHEEDIEKKIYETDPHCIFSTRPLYKFDFYIGSVLFAFNKADPNLNNVFEPFELSNDELFYSFDDLDVVVLSSTDTCSTNSTSSNEADERLKCGNFVSSSDSNINELSNFNNFINSNSSILITEREDCILKRLGWKKSLKLFESFLMKMLTNHSQWNIYLLASFYWRHFGRQKEALACATRAYDFAPNEFRSIVMLSAATSLQHLNLLENATTLLNKVLNLEPDNSFAHYQLANIKSISDDQHGAISEFNRVLHISPNFIEAKLRRSAIICHNSIEKALKSQHETLKNTLKNLKDYSSKSSLVEELYNQLRAQQPPRIEREKSLKYSLQKSIQHSFNSQ